MAYQSLYRTWRPRRFSEMVGQEAIVRALSNQAASGRVAHAYLFCGSRGTGKTSAARIMAMAINCLAPTDGSPCLECAHCKALAGETTLDIFEMDAASNSRVEEIREMLSRTDYPPQFVRHKVYIIDEVHMLSNAAFNALLKTLEEPPEYMVFILATTEPQKLPATILSRCQRFDFGRIGEREIVSRLKKALGDEVTAEDGALHMIAASAEGSMRDAWSLMDMCLGTGSHLSEESVRCALGAVSGDFLFEYLDALSQGDAGQVLKMTDEIMQGGRDVQVFLRDLSGHIRQMLAVKWTGTGIRELTRDQLEEMQRQAERVGGELLLNILEKCMLAETDARWASSPRAVLELFALRVCQSRQAREPAAAPAGRTQNMKTFPADPPKSRDALPPPDEVKANPPEVHSEPAPGPRTPAPDKAASKPWIVLLPSISEKESDIIPDGVSESPAPDSAKLEKTPKEAWNGMLSKLSRNNPGLYALLNRGKYGGYQDNTFLLDFSKEDAIYASLLHDEERSAQLIKLLSEEMGQGVSFSTGGLKPAQRGKADPLQDENIEALAREFGRDKIVVRKNGV